MPVAHSGSGVNPLVGGTVSAGLGVAPQGSDENTGFKSGAGSGQPYQVCNDGIDNDSDGNVDLLDTGCTPVGFLSSPDTDGDGYTDEAEVHIGTDALGRCEVAGTTGAVPSTDWPSDLHQGPLPNSVDRINILDLASFVAPERHLGASPGDALFDQRWDLTPGRVPLAVWINILDLAAMTAPGADTGGPPMFGGERAFLGDDCSANPTLGD